MKVADALDVVGNAHRYQKVILALLCLYRFVFSYIVLGSSYIFIVPHFKCTSTGNRIIQEIEACPIIEQCSICTQSCYLVSTYSVTASARLYCDKENDRNLISSSLFIGKILGLVLMNLVADRYGRRFSFLLSLYLALLGSIVVTAGGMATSTVLMMVGQLISGFGSSAAHIISMILVTDYCGRVSIACFSPARLILDDKRD